MTVWSETLQDFPVGCEVSSITSPYMCWMSNPAEGHVECITRCFSPFADIFRLNFCLIFRLNFCAKTPYPPIFSRALASAFQETSFAFRCHQSRSSNLQRQTSPGWPFSICLSLAGRIPSCTPSGNQSAAVTSLISYSTSVRVKHVDTSIGEVRMFTNSALIPNPHWWKCYGNSIAAHCITRVYSWNTYPSPSLSLPDQFRVRLYFRVYMYFSY